MQSITPQVVRFQSTFFLFFSFFRFFFSDDCLIFAAPNAKTGFQRDFSPRRICTPIRKKHIEWQTVVLLYKTVFFSSVAKCCKTGNSEKLVLDATPTRTEMAMDSSSCKENTKGMKQMTTEPKFVVEILITITLIYQAEVIKRELVRKAESNSDPPRDMIHNIRLKYGPTAVSMAGSVEALSHRVQRARQSGDVVTSLANANPPSFIGSMTELEGKEIN